MSAATQIPPSETLEAARHHHAQNQLLQAAKSYRQTLETNPQSQPALLGLSLIARQSGQLEPALRMAQAALAADPNHPLAWANYGDLLLASRNLTEAQSAYRRALAIDNKIAVAHYGLANTQALVEDYKSALPHFAAAARLNPTIPEFHFAQAFALGKLGEHAKAIAAYRRAVQLRPNFASAWLNLGVELIADGRDQLAELCYAQALASAATPDTKISTHLNHGHLLRSRKNFPAAQSHYQSALTLALEKSPTRLAESHIAHTYLHLEQGHFEPAHQSLQSAEAAQRTHHPGKPNPEIPNVRGILLLAQHTASSAIWVPPVSPLRPGSDASPASLLTQAIEAFHQAESQGHKTAPSNRGNALLRLGRVEEALQAHRTALQLDPHHPGVRYNLALTQLRAGNFREGWQNYEIRWQFREVHPHPRRFRQPRWQRQPNARLLIHAEQGLGDTLQFLRYLCCVIENAGAPGLDPETGVSPIPQILLEVQPPLTRLITQSLTQCPPPIPNNKSACHPEQSEGPAIAFPLNPNKCCHPERSEGPAVAFPHNPNKYCHPEQSEGPAVSFPIKSNKYCHPERSEGPAVALRSNIRVISQGDPIPPFTHQIPLMSLPALFQTTQETIPTPIPYLFSLANLTNAGLPTSLQTPEPKIGLHWAGNPNYRADRERSTQLQTFLPLLQIPQIQWISLQKGPAALEIQQLPPEFQPIDACSHDRDLADTAAVLEPLDLVLTTDSAVAHLAGAMGKPLWLLLPWQSDWRWMQDRSDTPWYPQARLFRQSSPGNWPELIHRVCAELHRWLAARRHANPL